jgi:2'-5' RNA ligase
VAVTVPDEVRESLLATVRSLSAMRGLAELRWLPAESWHLTLAFLGSTPPGAVPDVVQRLAGVGARHQAFSLPVAGLGAFPSVARARVVWQGLADPDRRLARLVGDVQLALGLPESERFRAHLTLARAPGRRAVQLPEELLRGTTSAAVLPVDTMMLMRSHLGGRGPHYEPLAALPLGALPETSLPQPPTRRRSESGDD